MSHITGFNLPFATIDPMHLCLPDAASCPKLQHLKAMSFDELMAFGSDLYYNQASIYKTMVSSIFNDTNPASAQEKLAETLYFRHGHLLFRSYYVEEMTRYQKEHEVMALDPSKREEVKDLSEFQLNVKLHCWGQQYRENRWRPAGGEHSHPLLNGLDSGYDTHPSIESRSSEIKKEDSVLETDEESEDDEEKPPLLVKVWKKKLGRYVTYAY